MVKTAERRDIVIYLDKFKTETDPIKRDALQRLLIQEVDKRARHYTGSRGPRHDTADRTDR